MFEEQMKIVYKIIKFCLENGIYSGKQQLFLLEMKNNLEDQGIMEE